VIALSVIFLWSANLIVQKWLCQEISLDFCNLLRFLSCVPLLFFFRKPPVLLFKLLLVTVFWNVLNFFFIGLSLHNGIGAGIFSVVYQTCTFFGVLFCYLLIKEVPKTHQLVGMIISFTGVILLFRDSFSNQVDMTGLLFVLLAAISWGIGVTLIKKYELSSEFSTNVWIASVAVIPMFGVTYLHGGSDIIQSSIEVLSFKIMMGILFAAYGAVLLAGCIWFRLLKKYPSTLIMPFMLLLPPMSCILSYFLLGERFTLLQISASLVILVGILVNQNILRWSLISYQPSNLWKKWISTN